MRVGDQIAGRYRLVRPIAAGGMGEVWAARNELTNRDFAIKFLLPEFAHHKEAYDRFVREASTTGKLQHPSIVDVFDVAQTEEGRPFIVMELLSGEDLETRLDREGTLSPLRVAAYFCQVFTALALAHDAGVVHRDLSASNIFLSENPDEGEPVPKILDFGVSKTKGPSVEGRVRTSNGAILGNPVYMSPEQARGAENVDERTDMWSLGVVMYQCLTGTMPFRSTNYNALMVDIMTLPHRPILELVPTLDPELVEIIEACLQKQRDHRPDNARDLGHRLGRITRRLSGDSQTLTRSPRRRATDRLPPPQSKAEVRQEKRRAFSALPIGVRVFRTITGIELSKGQLVLVAATFGALFGAGLAGTWHGRHAEPAATPSIEAAAVPGVETSRDGPPPSRLAESEDQKPVASEAPPKPVEEAHEPKQSYAPLAERRVKLSTREIDLGSAVARGISGKDEK